MVIPKACGSPELWADNSIGDGHACYWLYCIVEDGSESNGPCKIGIASNVGKRFCSLQGGNWRQLRIVWLVRLPDREVALRVEEYCLSCLRPNCYGMSKRRSLRSEWVDATPNETLQIGLRWLNAEQEQIKRVA